MGGLWFAVGVFCGLFVAALALPGLLGRNGLLMKDGKIVPINPVGMVVFDGTQMTLEERDERIARMIEDVTGAR
jgi:hypothetical protein